MTDRLLRRLTLLAWATVAIAITNFAMLLVLSARLAEISRQLALLTRLVH